MAIVAASVDRERLLHSILNFLAATEASGSLHNLPGNAGRFGRRVERRFGSREIFLGFTHLTEVAFMGRADMRQKRAS